MRRANASGCLAALLVGFALGLFRLAVDTPVTLSVAGFEAGYPKGSLLWIVNNTFFQYYSVLILAVSAATLIGVSYLTPPPPPAQLAGLTLDTVTVGDRRESRASWNRWDVINSAVVLTLIVAAYLYFNE
jgi:SSS family solute:Na+ symporter